MATGRPLGVLVFGAGAIGSYVGGSLALDGHRAVFLERPEVAPEIERSGIRIRDAAGVTRGIGPPEIRVASSPAGALAAGPFDVAIAALKSFDTPSLVEALLPTGFASETFPILCLSNGVDNEPALARAFGPARVVAGTVMTAIGRAAPGSVVVERMRGTGVAAGHPLSERLASAMGASGLATRLYASAGAMKWSKLLTNLLANATSAILDLSPAEIFAHPGLGRLEVEALREALAVMRASGIGVVNLPRTPVRLLALAARLPVPLARPVLARAVGGGRGGKMPSFHIDLRSGRGLTEVDWLNGAVVRHGEKAGVPAPVNRFLNRTLLALASQEVPLDTFSKDPGKLLEAARS